MKLISDSSFRVVGGFVICREQSRLATAEELELLHSAIRGHVEAARAGTLPEIEVKTFSVPKAKVRTSGFIYLMRNRRNGFIKIGYSQNPKIREVTLQSEEPDIEIIHSFRGSQCLEREMHRKYDSKRKRGEWFALSHEDISFIQTTFPK